MYINFKEKIDIYNSLLNAYPSLREEEKEDFDKGLTMLFNNSYYSKHKKSNINYDSTLVLELWDLTALLIKTRNLININKFDAFELLNFISNKHVGDEIFQEKIKNKSINFKVLLAFLKVLKSLAIINFTIKYKDTEELRDVIAQTNLWLEVVQSRFNFSLNTLPQFVKDDNKGKQTIILNGDNLSKTKLFNELKTHKLLVSDENKQTFFDIFSTKDILKERRVKWNGSNLELMIFLKLLKPYTTSKYYSDLFRTSTRCFIKSNGSPFEFDEISGASGKSKNELVIKNIFKKVIS